MSLRARCHMGTGQPVEQGQHTSSQPRVQSPRGAAYLGAANEYPASGTVRSVARLDCRDVLSWNRLRPPEICGCQKRNLRQVSR